MPLKNIKGTAGLLEAISNDDLVLFLRLFRRPPAAAGEDAIVICYALIGYF